MRKLAETSVRSGATTDDYAIVDYSIWQDDAGGVILKHAERVAPEFTAAATFHIPADQRAWAALAIAPRPTMGTYVANSLHAIADDPTQLNVIGLHALACVVARMEIALDELVGDAMRDAKTIALAREARALALAGSARAVSASSATVASEAGHE